MTFSTNLKGRWLEQAGFTYGMPILITLTNGCLIISPRPIQSPLDDVMAKADQLSYNLQRELGWFVNGLMSRQDKGSNENDHP